MHKFFLGIGGNIGSKKENFIRCRELIEKRLGKIILFSTIYETPSWGFSSKNNFWNQVIYSETDFEPEILLEEINKIEVLFGRNRKGNGYSSREMDIDILYFDDLIFKNDFLSIPHPLMHERLFVLKPLSEIAPYLIHPVLQKNSLQMLYNCKDTSVIKKVDL
ncbi:MAG: 2-amino-4-hydroxy-6-hydroxymethyldihydropteridine diphosphokinase [Bacteroidales bacterium]|jgi:2-amino-4-hydroxy-6-hydroxymethyldihydropteridine diphosphokinase|nr:2-amino-4-hydroxy-6-hydroxymethyldihydropteridine diphosphokinase [Bacteroidales bacterium]